MRRYLREDFKADLEAARTSASTDLLTALDALGGTPWRLARGRRTLRFTLAGKAYFVKRHDGVGLLEIGKNLLAFKTPVLGAGNEFAACARLRAHGVPAPGVAAFVERGRNPARRRSAVVLDAVEGRVSLEAPPAAATPAQRRRLLDAAAAIVRGMHDAGVYHRDCYAAHLLLDRAACDAASPDAARPALVIIDLHRARIRQPLPARWRRRDLAALLFSLSAWRLTRRETLRFAASYGGGAQTWRRDARFWRKVRRRAECLRARSDRRGRTAFPPPADDDPPLPSVTDFHTLARPPPLPFRFDVDVPSGPGRAVCHALPRWRPGRGFVAEAVFKHERRLLAAFCGPGAARRLRRAQRRFERLAHAGDKAPALESGRSGSTRVLLFGSVGRPAAAAEIEGTVAALARTHGCGLRPVSAADADYRVGPSGVWFVADQARRRPFVGRRAAEHDLAALLARLGVERPRAELLRRYEQARSWRPGRLRPERVAKRSAGACP